MVNLKDFLLGQIVVEEVNSPVNGKISVVKSIALGTYFQVGKLTQSGGVVYGIWKSTLNKIKTLAYKPNNVLIIGLGGGSCARILRKLWPQTHITGVDFDETIVDLGKKYLGLSEANADIVVSDAYEYVKSACNEKKEYSLIIVDLYVGQEFPVIFESDGFLENIKKALPQNGIVVFNRLYSGEKRPQAVKFAKKLEKYFTKVEYFYPEANVMLICTK
jgi:spermidine synthase